MSGEDEIEEKEEVEEEEVYDDHNDDGFEEIYEPIELEHGEAADKNENHWQLNGKIDILRTAQYGIVDFEYFFRCPWCGVLKKSTTGVGVFERAPQGLRVSLAEIECSDCLICEHCMVHYRVILKGSRFEINKAIIHLVEKERAQ